MLGETIYDILSVTEPVAAVPAALFNGLISLGRTVGLYLHCDIGPDAGDYILHYAGKRH